MFEALDKQSLSEGVYAQLRGRILNGDLDPGSALPSERVLCEMLGVNRGAVREGIKRLQQSGLVQVRQGGPTIVLNYLEEAGLELLPSLLIDEDGQMRVKVAKGIVDLRQSLAPSVARQAAQKADPDCADALDNIVQNMRQKEAITDLQELAFDYWHTLVNGSDNIAYKLAFNSLRKTYRKIWGLLTQAMAQEFRDIERLDQLAQAVRAGDAARAESLAQAHVAIGSQALNAVLDAYAANSAIDLSGAKS